MRALGTLVLVGALVWIVVFASFLGDIAEFLG